MGKKKNKKDIEYDYDKFIEPTNIGDICTGFMKIFGANIVLMRQLSSVYDGCKPGLRRLLYTMYLKGLKPEGNHLKVPSFVGATLELHPHGDAAIVETLVNAAREYITYQPLIDKKGNFGSVAGDSAASERYIEAKLSKFAYKCYFEDFDKNIIDTKPNYLNTGVEPEFLPAKYPVILINGTYGLGFSVYSHVPPFNTSDVLRLTIDVLENPDLPPEQCILVPDPPTGAYVVDEGTFAEICVTGKGKFKMRAKMEIDEEENSISIRNMPYQRSLVKMKNDIIKILNDMGVLKDIEDRTHGSTLNYTLILKKEVDPYKVMDILYRRTDLENTYPVEFKLFDEYKAVSSSLKEIIQTWIDFRREIIRRKYSHRLVKLKEREHVLEKELMMFEGDNAEKTISMIKDSETKEEAIRMLMDSYGISSLQAKTITKMSMDAYSKEEIKKKRKEKNEVDKEIKSIEKIIRSGKKIDNIIKKELEEAIELFGCPRKCDIITVDNERTIRESRHVVVVTENGFIKKLNDNIDSVGFINSGDYPKEIIELNNTDNLLLFDSKGTIHKLVICDIPDTISTSEGERISAYCNINGKITASKVMPTEETLNNIGIPVYFISASLNGLVKKTDANAYTNIKKSLICMNIKDNDELVSVKLLLGDKDILLYTNKGRGVRISSTVIKETNRMTLGVQAIDLEDGEYVIGMDIVSNKDKYIFVLTKKGLVKKCSLKYFGKMNRNDKPLQIITLDDNDSIVSIRTVTNKSRLKVYLASSVEEIVIEDILELPRKSKGKKMIGVKKGDMIIDVREIL